MNGNWETIREQLRVGFAKASQVLVFFIVCFYLLACVVATKPVGPKSYVSFINHCFQWQPGQQLVTQAYVRGK